MQSVKTLLLRVIDIASLLSMLSAPKPSHSTENSHYPFSNAINIESCYPLKLDKM